MDDPKKSMNCPDVKPEDPGMVGLKEHLDSVTFVDGDFNPVTPNASPPEDDDEDDEFDES